MAHDLSPLNPHETELPNPALTPPEVPVLPVVDTPTPPAPIIPLTPVAAAPTPPARPANTAAQIVWQWLTYVLWGWSLTCLGILLSATLTYFLGADKGGDYNFVGYLIAPLVVLLPLSVLADKFYSRQEPDHKHGFAAVILVFHAVLVFLVTIGSIITTVITLFSLLLDPGENSTKTTVIISSLVIGILGSLLFARIMNLAALRKYKKYFPLVVLAIAGLASLMAIVGPVRTEIAARSDRLIEENLSNVDSAISSYTRTNHHLPSDLGQIDLKNDKDAKSLITKKLITYRVVEDVKGTDDKGVDIYSNNYSSSSYNQKARYELCATYKKAKGYDSDSSSYNSSYEDSYISAYSHPSGKHCQTASTYVN